MNFDREAWLARLSFSFFIVGGVLLWQAYQLWRTARGDALDWRIFLYFIAAIMCFVVGAAGVRVRHARQRDDRQNMDR